MNFMKMAAALCVAILLCSINIVSADVYHITGSGTTTISAIMQTLGFAYQAVDTSMVASYTITSSGSGQANALAGSSDWNGVNSIPTKTSMAGLNFPSTAYRFNSLIHSGDALLPSYNLPGFTQANPLVIDQTVLFRIWNNQVQWWNDSQIAGLNPGVTLPTERIRLIYRPDAAGTTVPWITNFLITASILNTSYPVAISTAPAISSYPFWSPKCCCSSITTTGATGCTGTTYGASTTCPSMSSCQPYMVPATVSTYFSATRLLTTPYATGYLARPIGVPYGAVYFLMKNNANNIVSPTSAAVLSAFNTDPSKIYPAAVTYQNTLDLTQTPSNSLLQSLSSGNVDAWPITEYNVVLINNNVHTDCFRALALVQFLVWSFNSDTAVAAFEFLGAVQPPKYIVLANLGVLSTMTCGFKGQFAVFDTIFPYESNIFIAAVVWAVLFWCMAVAVIIKHRHPAIRRVGVTTLIVAAIAFGLNLFTVLLWLGYPTLPICQARPWVSATSFVVIYGAIIYIFQDRIFNRLDMNTMIDETIGVESSESAKELKNAGDAIAASSGSRRSGENGALSATSSGNSDTVGNPVKVMSARVLLVFLVGLVNFLIPIIWVAVEPPTVQTRQCVGSFSQAFRQAMLFYNIVLLIICTFGALFNRSRAQQTSLPIHIFLLAAALFIPTNFLVTVGTTFTIPDRSGLGIVLSPAVGILVSNIVIGLLVLLPPLSRAFSVDAEEELSVFMVEAQVDLYKERSKSLRM